MSDSGQVLEEMGEQLCTPVERNVCELAHTELIG
jgi:hypothetical protein